MLNTIQAEFYNKVTSGNFSKLLLTGEAGCGKTFVLTQALAELHRQGKNVLLCAPTHLARINLLNKMPDDVRPFIETNTVASLLSRYAFKTGDGQIGFSAPTADKINQWEVIAIDEVSMLSLRDYEVLKSAGAKIVFTGDFAQLPTIMQKGSGMAEDPDLERIHLVEQMRQQGVIHQIAERNRTEVYFPEESMSDDESSVTVYDSKEQLIEQMISAIIADPRGADAHEQYRLITFTNTEVYRLGQEIRNRVISASGIDPTSFPFVAGERLLAYASTPAAYNGEVVKVLDATPDPMHTPSADRPWVSYRVLIEGSGGSYWTQCVGPSDYVMVEERLEYLSTMIREAQKRKAHDAAAAYLAEIEFIRNTWTKLLYPFAITCHKSQGSTIEHVYVDTGSFAKAPNKRALLYVGLSRASKSLSTVKVEKPEWKVIREINDRYRAAKKMYEEIFNEPHWKVRVRTGLPARTPQEKAILTEYIECLIADAEQEANAEGEDNPNEVDVSAMSTPTLEPIAF